MKTTKHYILFDKPIKTGLISDIVFDEDLERIFGKDNHLSKTVIQTQDGKFVAFYNGIREAERQTGINHHRISECCRGNTRTAGGYEWQYITKGGDNE